MGDLNELACKVRFPFAIYHRNNDELYKAFVLTQVSS
jgi:hypothetical protein